MDDYRTWSATQGWHHHGWDEIHFEAWLLIEYLFEVKKLSLEQISDESVSKDAVITDMRRWAAVQSARG